MSEARIDRLLAAALHQAIADLLPDRLDFYESYLRPRGWREDAVNLGPVNAVLSFLRHGYLVAGETALARPGRRSQVADLVATAPGGGAREASFRVVLPRHQGPGPGQWTPARTRDTRVDFLQQP